MPYDVENPLASALGFASSYIGSRNQAKKDLRDYQDQQRKQALQDQLTQASIAGTLQSNDQSAASFAQQQLKEKNLAEWQAWNSDPKNAEPDLSDTKKYKAWASRALTKARSLGLDEEADKIFADVKQLDQGAELEALGAYTSGAKTNLTNAQTGYEQQLASLKQDALNLQLQIAQMRLQGADQVAQIKAEALLQATQSRLAEVASLAEMRMTDADRRQQLGFEHSDRMQRERFQHQDRRAQKATVYHPLTDKQQSEIKNLGGQMLSQGVPYEKMVKDVSLQQGVEEDVIRSIIPKQGPGFFQNLGGVLQGIGNFFHGAAE